MTNTSHNHSILFEIKDDQPISTGTLAYFRQRLRNHLYELVLNEFLKQEAEHGLTKVKLAKRIRRKNPSQITRWLSTPGNLEIDTISDLMIAMGAEPALRVAYIDSEMGRARNDVEHEWLDVISGETWIARNWAPISQSLLAQDQAQAAAAGLPTQRATKNESGGIPNQSVHQEIQTLVGTVPR